MGKKNKDPLLKGLDLRKKENKKYATVPIDGKPLVNKAGQRLLKSGLYDTGRKKKPINWEQAKLLCSYDCTQEEIAAVLFVSVDTMVERCREENGISFSEFFKTYQAMGNVSLRKAQFDQATKKGNTAMLRHLGINRLGQVERNQAEVIERVVYRNEATDLTDDQIDERLEQLKEKKYEFDVDLSEEKDEKNEK